MREVVVEVEQIATDLNLSESQNKQLKSTLTQARENIRQYKQENPNVTREQLVTKIAANRGAIRERVGAFLTP
jgi:predicted HTH transcriptional regulator